jgi:hypothetical protein
MNEVHDRYNGNPPVDAEFEVAVEDKGRVNTLPATLDAVKFYRHPKAVQETDYFEKQKKEIKLDIDLGLANQYAIDQKKLLQQDISSLTQSNNYYHISKKQLAKLFKIQELERLCFWHNVKEAFFGFFKAVKVPLVFAALATALIWGGVYMSLNWAEFTLILLGCVAATASVISCCVQPIGCVKFKFNFLDVRLKIERISDTKLVLPTMAKLKMKEAKDTEIFEDFSIAYPWFTASNIDYVPFKKDPVILGVAKDNRFFMVCWWDIAKDIDKIKTSIEMFKKFKIIVE